MQFGNCPYSVWKMKYTIFTQGHQRFHIPLNCLQFGVYTWKRIIRTNTPKKANISDEKRRIFVTFQKPSLSLVDTSLK